jgi:hypothetical protein
MAKRSEWDGHKTAQKISDSGQARGCAYRRVGEKGSHDGFLRFCGQWIGPNELLAKGQWPLH